MSGASAAERIPALDGLRGIAILLVIPHNADLYPAIKNWAFPFAMLAHAGWIGVQIFFVLSGFLITAALLDSRGSVNYYQAFYGRRIVRIFPLYFLVLIIFLLVLPRVVQLDSATLASYSQQGWLWVFLSNWTQPFFDTVRWFPHFWSLAVEEQFYLVWPFIVALAPVRHMAATSLAVVVLAVCSRIALDRAGFSADAIYMFTTTRMDALALGAFAAILSRQQSVLSVLRNKPYVMAGIAAAMMLLDAAISHVFDTKSEGTITFGYTLLAAAATLLLLTLYAGNGTANLLDRIFSWKLFRSCGKYSYAMYVFHMLVIQLAETWLASVLQITGTFRPILYSLAIILASYALGWLSYHLYERHFLALKRYFIPRCDGVRHGSGFKQG